MAYLLDANVLIALGDSDHVHHDRVSHWFFSSNRDSAWATCPLTENAFLRIISSTGYPNPVLDTDALRDLLARMCSWPGHQFWPDEITFRDQGIFSQLPGSKKLTDLYLLALAAHRTGLLATLDERIDPDLIPIGKSSLFIIPEP